MCVYWLQYHRELYERLVSDGLGVSESDAMEVMRARIVRRLEEVKEECLAALECTVEEEHPAGTVVPEDVLETK